MRSTANTDYSVQTLASGLSRYALQPSAKVGGCLEAPVRLTADVGAPSSALWSTGSRLGFDADAHGPWLLIQRLPNHYRRPPDFATWIIDRALQFAPRRDEAGPPPLARNGRQSRSGAKIKLNCRSRKEMSRQHLLILDNFVLFTVNCRQAC